MTQDTDLGSKRALTDRDAALRPTKMQQIVDTLNQPTYFFGPTRPDLQNWVNRVSHLLCW